MLERSVALLESNDPARLELECRLAEVLGELGRLQSAVTLLESIIERARALSDRRLEFRARVELVWPRLLDGSLAPRSAARLLDQALAHFDDVRDSLGVARAEVAYYALLAEFGNRADRGAEHLARADVAYRRLGQIGYTDLPLVHTGIKGGTPVEELIAVCHRRMAAEPDRPTIQAHTRHWLAFLLGVRGDLGEARVIATVARQQLAELGHELALRIVAAKSFGSIEAFAGNWDAAESNFGPALEYVAHRESTSAPPWRGWRAYFLLRMGEIALARGDPEHALQLAREARARSPVVDSLTSVWLLRIEARGRAGTRHPRTAARLAREAVALSDASDDLLEQGETRLDLAEVLLRAGPTRQAETVVLQGLDLLDRKGATLLATNGRARFAELLSSRGLPERGSRRW